MPDRNTVIFTYQRDCRRCGFFGKQTDCESGDDLPLADRKGRQMDAPNLVSILLCG